MIKQKKYISDISEFIAEWNWEKNNELGLDPSKITTGSGKKVWWKCNKGHEWLCIVRNRVRDNSKCPICTNYRLLAGYNDLATVRPDLAKQWHPTKNGNLKPTDIVYGSGKKIWWICNKGHEWLVDPANRVSHSTGCPYCNKYRQK